MGYYSKVTIVCSREPYNELKAVFDKHSFIPDKVYEMQNGDHLIRFDWLKWYEGDFEEVTDVMRYIRGFGSDRDDFISFFRFEEDSEDTEVIYAGSDRAYDYYIERYVGGFNNIKSAVELYY